MLEAALRSALLALERALAEQQQQRGVCGLCAPCLFPPCANLTRRCSGELPPHGPHCPIPEDPTQTQIHAWRPYSNLCVPIKVLPYPLETLPK